MRKYQIFANNQCDAEFTVFMMELQVRLWDYDWHAIAELNENILTCIIKYKIKNINS